MDQPQVATAAFELLPALTITTPSTLATAFNGLDYPYPLEATGGDGTYRWSVTGGTLPAGLTLEQSGAFQGLITESGQFTFEATVASAQLTAAGSFALEVLELPVVTTDSLLPPATAGEAYQFQLAASGGNGTYSWIFGNVGSLPQGLAIGSTGLVSGIPTVSGSYAFLVSMQSAGYGLGKWLGMEVRPARQSITVTGAGTGAGEVAATGLVCTIDAGAPTGTCQTQFDYGTVVTLTATADAGSTFMGWSGACAGTGNCVVTMDQAQAVVATFELNRYALTVGGAGNGSGDVTATGVTCAIDAGVPSGTCVADFDHGTVVTLTPAADVGSSFAGWSGACTGTNACQVTMDQARTVTASFTLNRYALTVGGAGNGFGDVTATGVTCAIDVGAPSGTCSADFDHGTVVTLTPTADTGSSFAGWSGACAGTNACQVTVDQARAVTATFTLNRYALTITGAGNGFGDVTGAGIICAMSAGVPSGTCSAEFDHGTVVTLAGAADPGSSLTTWGGACTGTTTCQVTMSQARTITATFQVTVVIDPDDVIDHLLGGLGTLTAAEVALLDAIGNGNGRLDIGDIRAWLKLTGGTP